MSNQEQWRRVYGHEALYEVSDLGRIRQLATGQELLSYVNGGYLRLWLFTPVGGKHQTVHTLVAEAFLGPRPAGMQVNHIDGDKLNNALSNLEYVTPRGNSLHATRVLGVGVGESHGCAKLTEAQVREIYQRYTEESPALAELGRLYGVSEHTIRGIITGTNWAHLGLAPLPKPGPRRKITQAQAEAIRSSTASASSLARQYNISRAVIRRIRSGEAWKDLFGAANAQDAAA